MTVGPKRMKAKLDVGRELAGDRRGSKQDTRLNGAKSGSREGRASFGPYSQAPSLPTRRSPRDPGRTKGADPKRCRGLWIDRAAAASMDRPDSHAKAQGNGDVGPTRGDAGARLERPCLKATANVRVGGGLLGLREEIGACELDLP